MKGKLLRTVVEGHYAGVPTYAEVWGCAVHPTEQVFASAGSDKIVRIWAPTK
jgi:WD40 repeat protein